MCQVDFDYLGYFWNRRSTFLGLSFFLLVFICGVSVPSVSSFIFFAMFLYILIVLKEKSFVELFDMYVSHFISLPLFHLTPIIRLWVISLGFSMLHIITLFLFQSLIVLTSSQSSLYLQIGGLMGLVHFNRFESNMWPNITGFVGYVALFFLVSYDCLIILHLI